MNIEEYYLNNYTILGIEVSFLHYNKILDLIFNSDKRTFACVNHYYLNLAVEDEKYRSNLLHFDLIHPDGIGIIIAKKILFKNSKKIDRVNGSDLYYKIFEKASSEKKSIYLLGDTQAVITEASKKLQNLYPQIEIKGFHHGFFDPDDKSIIQLINSTNSYMLLVGLGAKRQEYWTQKWHNELNVEKIINIGGGFRVISCDRARGPLFIRNMGLEWVLRLFDEPQKNWKRYLLGIPLFLVRIIKYKLTLRKQSL